MSPEIVAGGLAFLVFFLVLRLFAGRAAPTAAPRTDSGDARRYIDGKIDEHIETLADRYVTLQGAAPRAGEHRSAEDRFAPEIEAFIGEVLERDETSPHPDGITMDVSVREFLVLEREYVYRQIMDRVLQHVAATS
jgi:hypothetical protein